LLGGFEPQPGDWRGDRRNKAGGGGGEDANFSERSLVETNTT